MKKRTIAFLMIILLSLSGFKAYAESLTEKQNRLKESQNAITQLKNKLNSLKNSQNDVLKQISELDSAMNDAQKLLDNVNGQIDSINSSIKQTQVKLDKAIEEYDTQQELYASRVKAMYINGSVGYLEVLLSSESFGDFISRVETIKTVVEFDKNILTEMKQKQDEIAAKKAELEQQKSDLAVVQAQYKETVAQLKRANDDKQAYYKSIENDAKAVKKLMDAEAAESKALEDEIKRLLEQEKDPGNFSSYITAVLKVSDIGRIPPMTSAYGERLSPKTHTPEFHTGMDLGIPTGTPVYSIAEGKVIKATVSSVGYGVHIIISHANGIQSVYAHLSKLLVSTGDIVKAGQKIGLSGSTGNSTGPHLHFEIRKNGSHINPTPYYICGK